MPSSIVCTNAVEVESSWERQLDKVEITSLGIGIGTFQKHFWMQTHNDKLVRVGRIFSRPGSIKPSKPNIEIEKVDWSLRQVEWLKKKKTRKQIQNAKSY